MNLGAIEQELMYNADHRIEQLQAAQELEVRMSDPDATIKLLVPEDPRQRVGMRKKRPSVTAWPCSGAAACQHGGGESGGDGAMKP